MIHAKCGRPKIPGSPQSLHHAGRRRTLAEGVELSEAEIDQLYRLAVDLEEVSHEDC